MTYFISHPSCLQHVPREDHPESPARLQALLDVMTHPRFSTVEKLTAYEASKEDLLRVHSEKQIKRAFDSLDGTDYIDADTSVSAHSGIAAMHAVGAVKMALEKVMATTGESAFCAVRPPGHHSSDTQSGGFCLFNNIAIGAVLAVEDYHLSRVAIVDFDVHHGNGTQEIMWNRSNIFFASIHQAGIYPLTGREDETGASNNILNIPVVGGTDGNDIKEIFQSTLMPRLHEWQPELVLVSAGYDAHKDDPLGGMRLIEEDYAFMMQELFTIANTYSDGRLIAVLEGGYHVPALAASFATTMDVMMQNSKKSNDLTLRV